MVYEMGDSARVMLVDDHALVRASLRLLLESSFRLQVTYEAANGREAVNAAREQAPDLVLMDISMPVLDGIEATRLLLEQSPGSRVLMVTMHTGLDWTSRALQAGAVGYVTKASGPEALLGAIQKAQRGERPSTSSVTDHTFGPAGGRPDPTSPILTTRQRQVLELVALGCTSKEIARRLAITVKTVESHRTQLMRNLDIHQMAGLVRYAIRSGIVSAEA